MMKYAFYKEENIVITGENTEYQCITIFTVVRKSRSANQMKLKAEYNERSGQTDHIV